MVTTKTRKGIELCEGTYAEIAARYGVSVATVRRYKYRAGLRSTPRQLLTKAKVRAVFHAKGTNIQIGIALGVSPATVSDIKRGRYHSDVTGAGPAICKRRLTEAQRLEIGRGTEAQSVTAARFGVCISTVNKYRMAYRVKHGIAVVRRLHFSRS